MSVRFGSPLIAGKAVFGTPGLGVLGSVIRATTGTGTHGSGLLYNDVDSPADDAKAFRALIVTPPAAGSFFAYEDGSFTLTGAPDGAYSVAYRLFVDGADLGTATASITIGASAVSPGPATLILTTHAPVVSAGPALVPGAAALTLAGQVPGVSAGAVVAPGATALALVGLVPVITQGGAPAPVATPASRRIAIQATARRITVPVHGRRIAVPSPESLP